MEKKYSVEVYIRTRLEYVIEAKDEETAIRYAEEDASDDLNIADCDLEFSVQEIEEED